MDKHPKLKILLLVCAGLVIVAMLAGAAFAATGGGEDKGESVRGAGNGTSGNGSNCEGDCDRDKAQECDGECDGNGIGAGTGGGAQG
ncbi:MAG: hypothetical protein JXA49_04175, partial [Actinobacteria bacterium]|nr:hypothetical protein [Actinomycetota bacterium]